MIPRIIHQTAKTEDIPEQWRGFQKTVRSLHPSWEYKLWTDDANLELVSRNAPRWLALYQALPRNIMRADMIRYIILQLEGGLYLDLDYEVFRPFDLLKEKIVLPSESNPGEEVILGKLHSCLRTWPPILGTCAHGDGEGLCPPGAETPGGGCHLAHRSRASDPHVPEVWTGGRFHLPSTEKQFSSPDAAQQGRV